MTSETVRQHAIRYVCAAKNEQPERANRVERAKQVLDRYKIHTAKRAATVVWNLYAYKATNGQFTRVIMPDGHTLQLPAAPKTNGWYAVRWPVNPHFTGETMILEMLNQSWAANEASRASLVMAF